MLVTLTWRRAVVSRSSKTLNETDVFFLGDPKLSILTDVISPWGLLVSLRRAELQCEWMGTRQIDTALLKGGQHADVKVAEDARNRNDV